MKSSDLFALVDARVGRSERSILQDGSTDELYQCTELCGELVIRILRSAVNTTITFEIERAPQITVQ